MKVIDENVQIVNEELAAVSIAKKVRKLIIMTKIPIKKNFWNINPSKVENLK